QSNWNKFSSTCLRMHVMLWRTQHARLLLLHVQVRRTEWRYDFAILGRVYRWDWNSAFLIHFSLQKKLAQELVLVSLSHTALSKSIKGQLRSRIVPMVVRSS